MTDLPPGWEWATLGDIAETALGKMLDRKKDTGNHPVPYLRNVNVQWGWIDLDDVLTMESHPKNKITSSSDPVISLCAKAGRLAAVLSGKARTHTWLSKRLYTG